MMHKMSIDRQALMKDSLSEYSSVRSCKCQQNDQKVPEHIETVHEVDVEVESTYRTKTD